MELWDLYTANRTPTGKTHARGEALPDECYHLVVHVWIQNSKGEYLISQRSANRPTCPLMWECVGGSVIAGETSLDGALREVREEVGIDLRAADGKCVYSVTRSMVNGVKFNDILDVWLFPYDGEVSLARATTDEVAQTKWMTPAQIQALLDSGEMVNTLQYFAAYVQNQRTE